MSDVTIYNHIKDDFQYVTQNFYTFVSWISIFIAGYNRCRQLHIVQKSYSTHPASLMTLGNSYAAYIEITMEQLQCGLYTYIGGGRTIHHSSVVMMKSWWHGHTPHIIGPLYDMDKFLKRRCCRALVTHLCSLDDLWNKQSSYRRSEHRDAPEASTSLGDQEYILVTAYYYALYVYIQLTISFSYAGACIPNHAMVSNRNFSLHSLVRYPWFLFQIEFRVLLKCI